MPSRPKARRNHVPHRVGPLEDRITQLVTAVYATPRVRRRVYRVLRGMADAPIGRKLLPLALRAAMVDESRPHRVAVHINSSCNLACRYCYSDRNAQALDIERWLEVVDQGMAAWGLNFVQILGGEPLLHPRLPWFLDQLESRRVIIALNTNGTLLDQAWIARLRPLRRRLMLYVNFDCQEGFEDATGQRELYERVWTNIRAAREAGLHVMVFLTATAQNAHRLPALVELFDALGVGAVVERCLPVNPATADMEIGREAWQHLLAVLDAQGMMNTPNRLFGQRQGRACMDYGCIIYLLQDGSAIPCAFAPRELSLGNVEQDSLEEIWRRMQAETARWHALPAECGACDHAASCGGGCKTHAWLAHRRFDRRDPLCDGHGLPPTVVGL